MKHHTRNSIIAAGILVTLLGTAFVWRALHPLPAAPILVSPANGSTITGSQIGTFITFSWDAVANATSYKFQLAGCSISCSDATATNFPEIPTTATTFSQVALTASPSVPTSHWRWRVFAVNANGETPSGWWTISYHLSSTTIPFFSP